jgi:hypothetical protein
MTGVSVANASLAPGTMDPHWTVTPGGPTYSTNKAGPWRTPTNPVRWIQPVPGANPAPANAGVYRYRLQLVTPADPYLYTSFAIAGTVAADNVIPAPAIRLDSQLLTPGTCTPTFPCMNPGAAQVLNAVNSAQVSPGPSHVLEIQVTNNESVTGLYVDLTVKAVCSKCTSPRPPFQQKSAAQRAPSLQSLLQPRSSAPSC